MGKDDGRDDCDCDDIACAWMVWERFHTATPREGGICWYQDDDPDPDDAGTTSPGDSAEGNVGERWLRSCTEEGASCSSTAAVGVWAGEVEVLGSMPAGWCLGAVRTR